MIHDERRKAGRLQERAQEDFDRMKDELNGKMTRLRAECDDRVKEMEKQVRTLKHFYMLFFVTSKITSKI